jgi:hypothetical protein
MTATAADYTWFSERFPPLAVAYCLTLVDKLTPVQVLDRVGARERTQLTGTSQLVEPAYNCWGPGQGVRFFLGAASVGEGTLIVEPNGFLGVTDQAIVPLSSGVQLVSHYRNVDAMDRFCWVVDGDIRLQFEPLFPVDRSGSDPDGLVDVMRQVGFDLNPDEEERDYELHTEAAFALAEHLTGVRLTPALLESAEYICGVAQLPTR